MKLRMDPDLKVNLAATNMRKGSSHLIVTNPSHFRLCNQSVPH